MSTEPWERLQADPDLNPVVYHVAHGFARLVSDVVFAVLLAASVAAAYVLFLVLESLLHEHWDIILPGRQGVFARAHTV